MFNREVFGMALDRFRKHPVQTSLTLAGLVVGTAAIILVVSLGLTGRQYVLRQIEGVGSRLVWANYRGTVTSGVSRAADDVMTDTDVKAIAARSDLFSGVTGIVTLRGNVTVQSQSKTLTVLGVMPNYGEVRKNMRILRGRFIDEDDALERARVCVVNRDLYEQLFASDESADKTIRTLGTTFQVIGEFEEPVDTLGRGEVVPETILIPITVAWYYTPVRQLKTLFAEARDFEALPAAVEAVQEILRERHRAGLGVRGREHDDGGAAGPRDLGRVHRRLHSRRGGFGRRRGRGDHEYPARVRRAADARDRRPDVGRRSPAGHPGAVPLRGAVARRRGRVDRRGDRRRAAVPVDCCSGTSTSKSPVFRPCSRSCSPVPSQSFSARYRRTVHRA